MALTAEEQELFDIGRANLPEWYASDDRANEFLSACAKMFASSKSISEHWLTKLVLITLSGVDVLEEADWLDQHARDRGSSRQADEVDPVLIDRIRNVPDALTRVALLSALAAMTTAAGYVDAISMAELPRDRAYFGKYHSFGGSGPYVVASLGGDERSITPNLAVAPFDRPPFQRGNTSSPVTYKIALSGDGTYTVTGMLGQAAKYTGPASTPRTAPGDAIWTVDRFDVEGNQRTGPGVDALTRAYFSRGYVMSSGNPKIVVILPFETNQAFEDSVREMLRLKKAGGVLAIVERRLIA